MVKMPTKMQYCIDIRTDAAACSSSRFRRSSCSRRDNGRWPIAPMANACNFCSAIFCKLKLTHVNSLSYWKNQIHTIEYMKKKINCAFAQKLFLFNALLKFRCNVIKCSDYSTSEAAIPSLFSTKKNVQRVSISF